MTDWHAQIVAGWNGAAAARVEEPGWTLGELAKPGMLIAAGPNDCPYLIEKISRAEDYDLPCWRLTGWYAPGGIAIRNEDRRWWLNGWVASRYSGAPLGVLIRPLGIYHYDCPSRDACFIVVGTGAPQNHAGQLGLLL